MLSAIVRIALRFRGVVIALAALAIGYGVYSVVTAKYDVFIDTPNQRIIVRGEGESLTAAETGA